jgi:3-dehydroquinate dehydratase-2
MKILVLHGPNLNLTGIREPEVYGSLTLDEINERLVKEGLELGVEVVCRQSNHEGALIDALHDARNWADGVVFNPGGFSHTSVSLRDAVAAIGIPVVEVHMSNVYAREEFRHHSYLSAVCTGKIVGFGWQSYLLGLRAVSNRSALSLPFFKERIASQAEPSLPSHFSKKEGRA